MSKQQGTKQRDDQRAKHRVKAPGLQTIMGYILPKRTDCEVFFNDEFDCTELMKFIEKKNAEHPEFKTTIFHCVVTAVARMVRERPRMNRYLQGWQMYERDQISISFVAKRHFSDTSEESLFVLFPHEDDTLDTISREISGDVQGMRAKDEKETNGIDDVIDAFAALPRPILAAALRVVRYLDFWDKNPRILTEGDPNYTTVFMSNLGSIKCPAVYHHLNNYGSNSFFITIGTIHPKKMLMPDGSEEIRTVVDIGATLDDRIADGFYFARSLRLIKHILAHPEILDLPQGVPSGFDYEGK